MTFDEMFNHVPKNTQTFYPFVYDNKLVIRGSLVVWIGKQTQHQIRSQIRFNISHRLAQKIRRTI